MTILSTALLKSSGCVEETGDINSHSRWGKGNLAAASWAACGFTLAIQHARKQLWFHLDTVSSHSRRSRRLREVVLGNLRNLISYRSLSSVWYVSSFLNNLSIQYFLSFSFFYFGRFLTLGKEMLLPLAPFWNLRLHPHWGSQAPSDWNMCKLLICFKSKQNSERTASTFIFLLTMESWARIPK